MNILNKIIKNKKKEIFKRKKIFSIQILEKTKNFKRKCFSMVKNIHSNKTGIIAEFKRKSPSKGIINNIIPIEKVIKGYQKADVSSISIVTDEQFFLGKREDLILARINTFLPILRKDFIIDEYQIIESKSLGADAILLIAEILSKKEIKKLSYLAKNLGMETLIEISCEKDLNKITENYLDIIGINNRNLKDFSVKKEKSLKLIKKIQNFTKISESGIKNINSVLFLKEKGFDGFLIGEFFMNSKKPSNTCEKFIKKLKKRLNIF